jgi:glycosyltransferase involved in cell wall biosynthesis
VPAVVELRSPSFVPADLVGGVDGRTLGVPVVGVALGGAAAARLTRSTPAVAGSLGWLESYDTLVANSAFTAGWVRRLWGRDSTVLHPPVSLRAGGRKEQVVLAVGRFFPAGQGHSKKQLELVQAFRRLVDGGLDGWSLHLAGGCSASGRSYLEQVRAEAAGYPVELHVDAPGAELDALYARTSVFWHAAGLGEDPERSPDRLEHFGIATVEAMSAGAVPVVLRRGGLVETVRDGVDGLHVDDLDGFVAATRQLVADPPRLAAMSASAVGRAHDFSLEAFDARLEQLLAQGLSR